MAESAGAGEQTDIKSLIPELRTSFKETYKEDIANGSFHQADLDRLETNDTYAYAFLLSKFGDVKETVKMTEAALKFRKEVGVNECTESSFPEQMHNAGVIFYAGKDNTGSMILNMRIANLKKSPTDFRLRKQFVCWWMDKHFLNREHAEDKVAVLIDMNKIGIRDVDLETMKFIMSCFTTYYPSITKYLVIYEMPWLLNAMWKVIKMMLSEREKAYVKMLGKKEIGKYIDQEFLWPHMGGKNEFVYTYEAGGDCGAPWNTVVED